MYTAFATLLRRTFKDRPDWVLINEDVPLGTNYQIYAFRPEGITIINIETKEERPVMCYLARRMDIPDDLPGYLPVDVFNP
jgi:hypothetical protein